MGSGKGDQVFGHGIYFTNEKKLAEQYGKFGNLYRTTLFKGKAPSEHNLMDWYETIPQNLFKKIQRQANKEGIGDIVKNVVMPSAPRPTGSALYRTIQSGLYSDRKASEFLKRAGVNGIRLPNKGMSSLDSDEFTVVLFDASDASIIKTSGYQEISSAETSINKNKLPAIFKWKKDWNPNTTNIDIGGGKYNIQSKYLSEKGVKNYVYDPYNRTPKHNETVLQIIQKQGGADTATVSNVLNVIREKRVRLDVIKSAYDNIRNNGQAYFSFYFDAKQVAKSTPKGWQNHKRADWYKEEIESVFGKRSIIKMTQDKLVVKKDIYKNTKR